MKNVLTNTKKGILMVAILATVMGFANEVSIKNFKKDLKATALTIEDVKEGNLLSIKDDHGITLYKEMIKQSGIYTKGFDLTELPDGSYFFELDKEIEIKTIPFTVKSNKVTFNKEKETTIYKPFVREENGLIYISQLALDLEPLKISVHALYYDSSSEIVYKETIKGIQNIERVFKLETGSYKIVFNFNNKELTKYINN
ncbi:hypothetical protein N1F78_06675 [Seonamhaeicola sp. MEBiC1930]|uniref:hypothetical protein n=1 Tax=Seonamhaeicola sp. MEBiC01930 TaxID=2976768 RepID=UPI003249A8B6